MPRDGNRNARFRAAMSDAVTVSEPAEGPAEGRQLTVIEPSRGWVALRLGELWRHRELLFFMVWRDLKVRYRQTAFGALWAILQPVGLAIIFSLFLGSLRGISPSGVPYGLFVLIGLVPWMLFSQTVGRAAESLVQAADIIQKVYFPRLLLPLAAVGSPMVDFGIGIVVVLIASTLMGFIPGITVLWMLPLTAMALATALAAGIWLAALNVRYRDVRHAVPFILQVWLFSSPVIYSAELVPESLRPIYYLNPMAGVIDGFRWALLGGVGPPIGPVLLSMVVTVAVLVGGLAYFRRVERAFADVI
ncbi:ABC transporter permease [soil metagenome]